MKTFANIALLILTIVQSTSITAAALTTSTSTCCDQQKPTTLSFTVSKQGEVSPDMAQISLIICHTTYLMVESYNNVSVATQNFYSSLMSLGVPKDNISTTAFSTSPVYNYTYHNQTQVQIFVGYSTTNSLNVNVNVNLTGQIIDVASTYPLLSIQSVSFSSSDSVIQQKQQELLAECSESANLQAQMSLNPLNLTLKKYLSISSSVGSSQDNQQYSQPYAKFANADMAEMPAAAPTIQMSGTKTQVTAQISYTVEYE